MELSPDQWIMWQSGVVRLNATIVFTWVVMFVMVAGAWLLTRNSGDDTELTFSRNLLEVLLDGIRGQIREVSGQKADPFLPFVGTMFLFIAVSNLMGVIPQPIIDGKARGFQSPTGSLSTTAALAFCVFVAVPFYGIWKKGFSGYLRNYISPSWVMLPFNIVGEISRTLALAVRLFGNVMSGSLIVGTLLAIAPIIFPAVMQTLGLLTGVIQAYIFAMLAMVYIASATNEEE